MIKRADRDETRDHAHRPASGCHVNKHEALEKALERVLHDVRELKRDVLAQRPVPRRKTREAVPSLVTLIFDCFPAEYAE